MHNAMQQIVETYSEAMQHTMDTRGCIVTKNELTPLVIIILFREQLIYSLCRGY